MSSALPSMVFVIGAGASKEFNLPLGEDLKDQIAKALSFRFETGTLVSGDAQIYETLQLAVQTDRVRAKSIGDALEACRRIRDAMPLAISIDNFIDAHRDHLIEMCAKLAIVKAILQAEQNSSFRNGTGVPQLNIFKATQQTWINLFFKLLTENCPLDNLPARLRSVALIIFNYDRCIELFLHNALQTYYGVTPEIAQELLSHLEIHHPYGQVGSVLLNGTSTHVPFADAPHNLRLLELAGQIKTFSEGTDPNSEEFKRLTEIARDAPTTVFLGFAFHKLNMDLLIPRPVAPAPPHRQVFATAYEMSEANAEDITIDIGGRLMMTNVRAQLKVDRDSTCAKLLRDYWRPLSRRLAQSAHHGV